uniref:Uncharacterized protein n=1 Tax=Candidatus Kentrum sp. MB TaxID=2138164 RepID=A0A450XF82_9GAMM|nr:MAG: hypothetical protein BECKMB1821G_GA0114241_100547 [Candidatus Kentron sp. MB]VFK27962.1 MAG: hypothetical protein BECKMB1821I_GA0114274_100545 [Candidatus Kentron sp. MB]VFK74480.1 MAG: hypothetical protein BECKMB1821H_GA0114242_100545 [Candidatus Kentron sp. MB]
MMIREIKGIDESPEGAFPAMFTLKIQDAISLSTPL